MSYSPMTGLVYIPAIDGGFIYVPADPSTFAVRPSVFWNNGLNSIVASLPDDEAIRKAIRASAKGRLVAWDPIQRKVGWQAEFPIGWNGGLLTTAGGLVFQGNGTGRFVAYDATSGTSLWNFYTQTGVLAAPVTYEVDGEQYVTVMAGWGGALPLFAGEVVTQAPKTRVNRVLTFKLDATGALPVLSTTRPPLNPPAMVAAKATADRGSAVYRDYCSSCHGHGAVSGGVVPDLRYAATLGSPEAYKSIVLDGALERNGMVSFSRFLRPDDVEAVRAFVIQEAHAEKTRLANP